MDEGLMADLNFDTALFNVVWMRGKVNVAGLEVEPGDRDFGLLKIPSVFPDGEGVEIPFIVLNGAHDGPWLHLQVAQHGVEINALEAMRRVLSEIELDELRGTLVYCLPNPIAFRERQTVMSYDPIPGGMNRVWPGRPEGSLTERMAYEIWVNLISGRASHLIDFHTGRRRAPVWVYYEAPGVSPGVPEEVGKRSERMARVFGAEILYLETEPYGGGKTCRGVAVDHGIPGIVPEIGGEGHFNPEHVEVAYRGLRNVMIDLGMISGEIKLPKRQVVLRWVANQDIISVRDPKGGVFIPRVEIGERVEEGQNLGFIYSPRTFEEIAMVRSPRRGLVFSIVENPIVVAGQPIISIPEIIEEITNQ
jgi:predicted deacylase